jgi:hypothetical protein
MAELRPAADPGRWLLDLDADERDYLLAGLDFARAFLARQRAGHPVGPVGFGSTSYPHRAGDYQAKLDPIEQALAFPSTAETGA